jgi:hypothetical protein
VRVESELVVKKEVEKDNEKARESFRAFLQSTPPNIWFFVRSILTAGGLYSFVITLSRRQEM